MKSHLLRSLLCILLLTMSALVWAQTTGQITGTVRDNTGAVVNGAKVTITDSAKGISRATTSNSAGEYLVSGLGAATYDLNVTSPGFKTFSAKGVVLQVGQKARVDVDLQVGAVTTEVVVQGTQVAQVETQSSDLSGVVSGKEITQLQLNGRNFTQLVTLVPGVSNQTGQDEGQVGVAGNVSFSVNGGRVEYNNWELDGGDNMDNGSNDTLNVYPSIDAISEFRVLTSNYGAQYGRNGSGTVEVETKSGTNAFHGDAYEFVRNDAFNARNYFDTSVPPYKKNDFGYTIGGPITIPKVYNTDRQKTFFFWSQEWRRDRVPNHFNQQVPSPAERGGDFTDQCPDSTGSFSNCPSVPGFTNSAGFTPNLSVVPAFAQNATVAQALVPLISVPNVGSGSDSFFVASVTQPTTWREELLRVDHNLTNNARLTFRYIHDSWNTTETTPLWTNQGSFPTIGTDFGGPGTSLVARLTNTFSPTLLNEFVFSYTTDHIILHANGAWKRPSGLPIGDLFGGNGDGFIPGINLVTSAYGGGFGEDPGYIPNGLFNSNPTYTYRDNVSKIVGKHNLQFGAYFVAGQKNELGGELSAGSIPGYLTFDTSKAISSGNAFADLLLGNIASFGQQNQRIKYYNRFKYLEPYFQDDWHVTSRLTLNLGLRVSLFGTYRERLHQAFNFDPAHYNPNLGTTIDPATGQVLNLTPNGGQPSVSNLPNGIVQCGVTPGVPVSCMQGHLFNPAPRIGFAWDPKGDGKTAIRAGYGIFFEHANGNEGNTESLENSPPLANTFQQTNISGYANIGAGFNPTVQPIFPLNVTAIPTKAVWPYVQQWHLDVQRDIIKNTVLTVSYVGSKGTHLNRQTDLNQIFPVPANQNPFKPGEPNTCATNSAGTAFLTPSNVAIGPTTPGFLNMEVSCGADPAGNTFDPNTVRPFLGYSDIANLQFAASSNYNALQSSLRHQLGGLQLTVAYTYSHSIDDASDRFDGSFVDSYHPFLNRASSNFDQRHVFNLSYVYDLPFFRNSGLSNKILGGWQWSGITTFQTGTPYSVVFSGDNAGVANGIGSSSRADIVGNPYSGIPQSPLEAFGPLYANPNAFAAPTGLTFGDSGRNILTNPHTTNFDMALFKHFGITEHTAFEFRAEAFNIFNHTQWWGVGGDSGSGTNNVGIANNTFSTDPTSGFLRVSAAHNPRILQLGLKFLF